MHAGHGFTHTTAEIHDDGSATIEHHHHEGPHKNKRYAVRNLDEMHDGLENHLRHPANEEELEEKIHPGIHDEVAEKVKEGE